MNQHKLKIKGTKKEQEKSAHTHTITGISTYIQTDTIMGRKTQKQTDRQTDTHTVTGINTYTKQNRRTQNWKP